MHLRRISEYSLADLLAKRIPVLRDRIKTTVMGDFRAWLTLFREHATAVGPLAMRDASSQGHVPSQEAVGLFDEARVDFTPVYRCLHIYETLGARSEFKDYYLENRKVPLLFCVVADEPLSFVSVGVSNFTSLSCRLT